MLDGQNPERESMGWLPMIFGVNWFGTTGVLMSALEEADVSWRDPEPSLLYDTAEEAMAAYETATPVKVPGALAGRSFLKKSTEESINENGLFRSLDRERNNT